MKSYYISISIAVLATFLMFVIPQFTGTIYVQSNNTVEVTPTDWLSKILFSIRKIPQHETKAYRSPSTIHTIKVIGQSSNKHHNHRFDLFNASANNELIINYADGDRIKFTTEQDTLFVQLDSKSNGSNLTFYLNDTLQQSLIFEQINEGHMYSNNLKNINVTVDKKSMLHWIGRNSTTQHINVRDQSNLLLFNANQPIMDITIENSIVNVAPINQLDSVHAMLIGKSNIKTVHSETYYFDKKEMDSLQNKARIRIYPTGDLEFRRNIK